MHKLKVLTIHDVEMGDVVQNFPKQRGSAWQPHFQHRQCIPMLFTTPMLLKPDKLPSLSTSYRPISLISSIMKLFERVIEQRLRPHLEHIGFINKHHSGFRKAKSTDDHLFRLSQSIMESLTEENM